MAAKQTSFRFKQFEIHQEHCAMKVGTDGVLLGAWCNVNNAKTILDIGTGTGLIAMMLAQRSHAFIDAVEIDKDAAQQASENVNNSIFAERIAVINADINMFAAQCNRGYDIIVCNPPYFTNALKNPDSKRATARHNDALPFDTLIDIATQLLNPTGHFAVILPDTESCEFIEIAKHKGLSVAHVTIVKTTATATKTRQLISLTKQPKALAEDTLVIASDATTYTDAYKALTAPFYLNF